MALDRLARLIAVRDAIEDQFRAGVEPRDFAALSREFRATLAEIDELSPKEVAGDAIDEIAARRDARRGFPSAREGRA